MDDLNEKITALLSDPSALEGIRNMASSLLGNAPLPPNEEVPSDNLMPDIDIGKVMSVLGRLKNTGTDERTRLLLALKPHLSERRRDRVDRAIKILKLLDMLPLLQDSGFLNFL